MGIGREPPSQTPTGWGCRFSAGWQVEGSGREGREEESKDHEKVLGEETKAGNQHAWASSLLGGKRSGGE